MRSQWLVFSLDTADLLWLGRGWNVPRIGSAVFSEAVAERLGRQSAVPEKSLWDTSVFPREISSLCTLVPHLAQPPLLFEASNALSHNGPL